MVYARAVELSETGKMGLVHATYVSQVSCPASCPFQGSGCYAEYGNMLFHTRRLNRAATEEKATALDAAHAEADAIREDLSGNLDLRLHVVGDCATDEAAAIVSDAALHRLRRGRIAWSYTHGWREVDRVSWGGVSLLASVEKLEDITPAQDRGYATAIVVPMHQSDKLYTVGGMKLLPCPQQTRGVSCVDCRLCMNAERLREKGITIAFAAHGSGSKRVLNVLHQLNG